VQAQDLLAPYGALHARLDGFERADLDRALLRRRAVKATLMRGTLHLVSAKDHPLYAAALTPALRRLYPGARLRGASEAEIDALARRAVAFGSEPRTNGEYREQLGGDAEWFRARFHSPFVHVPPFTRQSKVVSAAAWLGAADVAAETAVAHLVRRYLSAFGPASVRDAARWAGVPQATIRDGLERVRHVDLGDGLLDLPRAPRPGDVPAPPRLLPLFDELLLAHDDRTRVVPAELARAVNPDGGMILRTFLVDGVVAGLWRTEGHELRLAPFAPLPRVARRELEAEAQRTAASLDRTRVRFG
jgi:Winged helix DNA-binding domain